MTSYEDKLTMVRLAERPVLTGSMGYEFQFHYGSIGGFIFFQRFPSNRMDNFYN